MADERVPVDPLLAGWVLAVEGGALTNLTVSLLAGGQWVAGDLISESVWLDLVAGEAAAVDGLAGGVRSIKQFVDEHSENPSLYVHLSNTRPVTWTGPPITWSAVLLRLKLTDVSGWALGHIGGTPPA